MEEKNEKSSLMHEFKEENIQKPNNMKYIGIFFVVALLGIGTGFGLTQMTNANHQSGNPKTTSAKGTSYGVTNTKEFPDQAEGLLKKGGIEGEGAFHLERPGGDTQNVYLTSSIVDLSQLIGKKVRVWGQTQSGQHAGWLMDVGKVEVL
ncbi:MAG: hypothetical protein HZC02_03965 [Candidatus Levybacteria bacterium]|nr:hypothetical protein [Candidatus Levybacteria bacterium]